MSINLEKLADNVRKKVHEANRLHRYQQAIFLADKLVTFTNGSSGDVYLLADTYYLAGQYKRCIHLLKYYGLVKHRFPTTYRQRPSSLADRGNIQYVYLAARCLLELSEWAECLDMLGDGSAQYSQPSGTNFNFNDDGAGDYRASIYYIRGRCMEMLDYETGAVHCFRMALQIDPCHTEAFERLIEGKLMGSDQEREFLSNLTFPPENEWVKLLYYCKLNMQTFNKKVDSKQELQVLESQYKLQGNVQLQLMKAQREFDAQNFRKALAITSNLVHEQDPYSDACLTLHICLLVELKDKTALYSLSNTLVESRPQNAISWFCIGCYYYAIRNYEKAGKFFTKATHIDMRYVAAWVAYGHTFSNVEESDQAMAAYRNAVRLQPGCHLWQLYMGMEHIHSGNLQLAAEFIQRSRHCCPFDPLVYNELGVVAYKMRRYEDALRYFQQAMQFSPTALDCSEHWEYAIFNYANTLRKLKRYSAALVYYNKALSLKPHHFSSYSSIGFTYHLMGQLHDAIEYYHRALSFKCNDTFSLQMLEKALEEVFHECSEMGNMSEAVGMSHRNSSPMDISVPIESPRLSLESTPMPGREPIGRSPSPLMDMTDPFSPSPNSLDLPSLVQHFPFSVPSLTPPSLSITPPAPAFRRIPVRASSLSSLWTPAPPTPASNHPPSLSAPTWTPNQPFFTPTPSSSQPTTTSQVGWTPAQPIFPPTPPPTDTAGTSSRWQLTRPVFNSTPEPPDPGSLPAEMDLSFYSIGPNIPIPRMAPPPPRPNREYHLSPQLGDEDMTDSTAGFQQTRLSFGASNPSP